MTARFQASQVVTTATVADRHQPGSYDLDQDGRNRLPSDRIRYSTGQLTGVLGENGSGQRESEYGKQ
jgi:hypothetical protein